MLDITIDKSLTYLSLENEEEFLLIDMRKVKSMRIGKDRVFINFRDSTSQFLLRNDEERKKLKLFLMEHILLQQ